ncbi:TPA: restriction endonuclease subunit S [Enterococcus faecium]
MSNDTQPEIRFPGFTEDWEERKLGEVTVKIGSGKTPKGGSAVYSEKGIPLLRSQNIYNDRVNFNDIVYITKGIDDSMANSHVLKDDVLLNITGASIGRSAVYSKEHLANVNQHVCIIRPGKNVNPFFIQLNITSPKGQKEIELNQAGGGREGLNFQQIARMTFFFPNKEEQAKIGTFFKQLDDTIALHQRKLDLLKETKKGFLQKMFPKNGAKVPEIRFPGFTEDWEERRLQEVVDRYDNLRIPITASKRVAGNTPYYGANGIQGYVEGYTHDGEFILVAEDGANDLKNYPVQYVDGKVWVNNHAHVIQAKENLADNMFLMNAIRSINIEPFLVGGGRAKLNADVLMKLEVIIPLKSEQQKIGAFFKQLDDIITLHQRKLDLLKETKKGFLQKMFV